jgi:hypothetical protein
MAATVEQVLRIARGEIGYREGSRNDNKYGRWYGVNFQPWCAIFVSWVFAKAGQPLRGSWRDPSTWIQTVKGFSYTPFGARWFKVRRRWGLRPRPGAIVFFYWPSMGRVAHVGIVESVSSDGRFMTTIEGNTNNSGSREGVGVFRMKRSTRLRVDGGYVEGFGYPTFARA